MLRLEKSSQIDVEIFIDLKRILTYKIVMDKKDLNNFQGINYVF